MSVLSFVEYFLQCSVIGPEVESHEYVLHVDVRSNAFPIWLAADTFPTDGGVGVDLPGLRYGMFNISMNILQFIRRQSCIMSTLS